MRFLEHDCATRWSSMLQFLATSPLVSYFIYACGEQGQYRAVLVYELVKHVFEFVKEVCKFICCIRVVTINGLSLWSSSSYLCIAYGGIGKVCGLVRYAEDSSEIDVFFLLLSLFLEFIR